MEPAERFRTLADGTVTRTVTVAIGPESGTAGPELICDAAKEPVKIADLEMSAASPSIRSPARRRPPWVA